MKRKIIYVLLVVVVALVVSFLYTGCSSGGKETEGQSTSPVGTKQPMEDKTDQSDQNEDLNGDTPVSSEGATSQKLQEKTVTISISCGTIKDHLDVFDQSKLEILPADGVIVPETQVEIGEGDTVFDVLLAVTKDERIHMEYVSTPIYSSNYIEGIGNIYEIDAGPLSGWMYKVNGEFPNYGCGRYVVEAGDRIEWVYTCDLGRDIGGDWNEQNQ